MKTNSFFEKLGKQLSNAGRIINRGHENLGIRSCQTCGKMQEITEVSAKVYLSELLSNR